MSMFKTYFNVISKENDDCNQADIVSDYKNDSIALVEASAEQDALIEESTIVDDTIEKVEEDVSDIKEALDTNEANMATGGVDQITPVNVAIATQSLSLRLERLGLNLKDLSSYANISKETFLSKENGGMGCKPSDILKSLHHDMSKEGGILDKIKAGAREIWKAICYMARKIADFVINLFRSQKSIMEKLLKQLEPFKDNRYKIDYYKVAPAYAIYWDKNERFNRLTTYIDNNLVKNINNIIGTANSIIKEVNNNESADSKTVEDTMKKIMEHFCDIQPEVTISGIKSIPDGKYGLVVLRKKSVTLINGKYKDLLQSSSKMISDIVKTYSVSSDDLEKNKKVDEIYSDDVIGLLRHNIKNYEESNQSVKAIKEAINNMEKLSAKEAIIKSWLANNTIKYYFKNIVTYASQLQADCNDLSIMLARRIINVEERPKLAFQ